MSTSPHTIGAEQTLAEAAEVMRTHGIRHLPVLQGRQLVGVVSDRDLKIVEAFPDVKRDEVPVSEAIAQEAYAVAPDTAIVDVVDHMADHRYGSAVVVDGNDVVGIFTTIDALRALSDVLHGR